MGIILKGISDQITLKTVAEVLNERGTITKVPFKVTWKRMTVSEAVEITEDAESDDYNIADTIRKYIVSVNDLVGSEGEKLEYSKELLNAMLEQREYRVALRKSLTRVAWGIDEDLQKN